MTDPATNHTAVEVCRSGPILGGSVVTSALRQSNLDGLRAGRFDLLVVGGGITGAGIALDATLRGLRTGLIDKGDFACGTSSASSKLIHGGLRYLEHGELGLVREALRERHTLLRIAPHLVRPLRILLPHYSETRRPAWMLKVGLTLYDWLAGPERIGRHRRLGLADLLAAAPALRSHGLDGGFEFFDAQMDDARLCLEVVLTAMAAGARAANYVELIELRHNRTGQLCGCEAIDRVRGERFPIEACRIVNAAGPWLDEICRIDDATAPTRLAPTKGVHVLLPNLGLEAGLLLTHPEDGRVMFVLPWMRRTLVGTTDSYFDDRPDRVAADEHDVAYLQAAVDYYFGQQFANSPVLATMAGLRPLLRRRTKDPSAVSREFAIFRSNSGLWSIAGGKYTTYRSMAEKMVDHIVQDLGGEFRQRRSNSREHRLVGTPAEDWDTFRQREAAAITQRRPIDLDAAHHLLDRYGQRALLLEQVASQDQALWQTVVAGEPDLEAELPFQAEYEMTVSPVDHLFRRTRLGLFHPELAGESFKWPRAAQSATLSP